MSKLKTPLLVAVLLLNTALAGGALYLANLSRTVDYGDAADALGAGDITQVAGYTPDAEQGDLAVPLSAMQRGGNFRVDFTAGKQTTFGREEHEGTWDELSGAVVYRPETQELLAIEVSFLVTSLHTDALPLTNTVLAGEKWFDYENHPTATFSCTSAQPIDTAERADLSEAATHILQGTFTLNGVSKALTIPATLSFAGQSLTLDASFELLRSAFSVEKREGSLAGAAGGAVSEVDDAVQMRVRLTASPDPSAVIAELANVVEAQRVQLDGIHGMMEQMENRLRMIEAGGAPAAASSEWVDPAELSASFADTLPVYSKRNMPDGREVPEVSRHASFEMVLVPGDRSKGVAPFYISRQEVTWEMYRAWSYCRDVEDVEEINRLINAGLRPTPLFGDPSVLVQINNEGNPARAVSRLSAESFCKWLTEVTGRRYRLPTEAEWEHALLAGGGVPDDVDPFAWHFDNAPYDEFLGPDPGRTPASMSEVPQAGTKQPNALGVHDMLGSVSEWVIPANPAERALRGGNMRTRRDELVLGWREVEDRDAWFAAYPNEPKSLFWYPSYEFGGIRLVCEAQSVLDNPPTGGAPGE